MILLAVYLGGAFACLSQNLAAYVAGKSDAGPGVHLLVAAIWPALSLLTFALALLKFGRQTVTDLRWMMRK